MTNSVFSPLTTRRIGVSLSALVVVTLLFWHSALLPVQAANEGIHVTPTGSGDGSSWASATTLQDTLQNQVQANDDVPIRHSHACSCDSVFALRALRALRFKNRIGINLSVRLSALSAMRRTFLHES